MTNSNNLGDKKDDDTPLLVEKIETMDNLLDKCVDFGEKFKASFASELLTLENFGKLLEIDLAGLTISLLDRCQMALGEFV